MPDGCHSSLHWNIHVYQMQSRCAIIVPDLSLQGRALSRAKSRRNLDYMTVLDKLEQQGISIRVASPKLVMEEVS